VTTLAASASFETNDIGGDKASLDPLMSEDHSHIDTNQQIDSIISSDQEPFIGM
jgi:hypothetical protein